MKEVPGSSPLTEEQQQVWLERRGVNYVAVAEQPLRPSRRVRRALRSRGAARNLTQEDIVLLERQRDIERQLRDALIKPVL